MKILVLGGRGFIGRHLATSLLEEGHEVAIFHRGEREADPRNGLIHIRGERSQLHKYSRELYAFSPQVVIDLIAFTGEDALSAVETFGGRIDRLLCASSMDVYQAYGLFRRLELGAPDSTPFAEDAPLRTSLYPYRKLARDSEDLLYNYDKIVVERILMGENSLSTTILRLPQVFGPGDRQHRLRRYLRQMDAGEDIVIDEQKASWRWTRGYVEDIAFGFVHATLNEKAAGRVYNLGEKEAQPEIAWIERIGRIAQWTGKILAVPAATLPDDLKEPYDWSHHLAANTALVREELGYREVTSLDDALRRAITWERNTQD